MRSGPSRAIRLALAATLPVVGLGLAATGCSDPEIPPAAPTTESSTDSPNDATSLPLERPPDPCVGDCSLREAAEGAGFLAGVAVDDTELRDDPSYRAAVAEHFNSLTPENAMKWTVVRPDADRWDWTGADEVVDFAGDHGMSVRGHTLVWGQAGGNGVPQWLADLTDPEAFTTEVLATVDAQVRRYSGRIDRWDVVNEPLQAAGPELDDNVFLQRMGPDYLAGAFEAAHRADPSASLWLNENSVEYLPLKAAALVDLVTQLVERGVPIDGVGLQTHLVLDAPLAAGRLAEIVGQLSALGLDVAVTELDVPVGPTRDVTAQIGLYRQVVSECRASGCSEITVWGLSDAGTWLDAPSTRRSIPFLSAFSDPSNPLLLDDDLEPKAAYRAVVEEVLR